MHFFRRDAPTVTINVQRPLTRVQALSLRTRIFPALSVTPGPITTTGATVPP